MSKHIRFGEPIEPEIPIEKLPPENLLIDGRHRAREKSFQVYILQGVYDQIWRHVGETPKVESGGVLVGHPFRTPDGQITFVIITAAIPQNSESRSIGHFTVGPQEIAAARTEMEKKHTGLVPVGWYHSHPGHGVFLSRQDMTIVGSIYDSSWHVALVIDPQQRTEGVFFGPEGKWLGEKGNDRPGSTLIRLQKMPDSIKAIALYNQLQELVENSSELRHWKEQDGYRTPIQSSIRPEKQPEIKEYPYEPPEPTRRQGGLSGRWLALSIFMLVIFAAFVVVAVFLIEDLHWGIVLGLGGILSFIAVVAAGYVIVAREDVQRGFGMSEQITRFLYSAGERVVALVLIGLVLFVWALYTLSQNGSFSVPSASPTSLTLPTTTSTLTWTPVTTQEPVVVPQTFVPVQSSTATPLPTGTPTLTPTPTTTPTSTPTPTVTSTPTLTPTFTWTPTITATEITPTTEGTTLPTPSLATTAIPTATASSPIVTVTATMTWTGQ